jgi:hypothetical protein
VGAVQTRRLSRHDPERSAMTSVHWSVQRTSRRLHENGMVLDARSARAVRMPNRADAFLLFQLLVPASSLIELPCRTAVWRHASVLQGSGSCALTRLCACVLAVREPTRRASTGPQYVAGRFAEWAFARKCMPGATEAGLLVAAASLTLLPTGSGDTRGVATLRRRPPLLFDQGPRHRRR